MRTNLEKYNHYKTRLDDLCEEYLEQYFPDGLPENVYYAGREHISEKFVTGAYYVSGFYREKKPTRIQVAAIKACVEGAIEFTEQRIRIRYRADGYTGSFRHMDVLKAPERSYCKDDLLTQLEANRKKYVLKDGDARCNYCGRAFPEKDGVRRVIYSRSYRGGQKEFLYCCQDCGGYDQMGHEG